jgi:hypothetical protein
MCKVSKFCELFAIYATFWKEPLGISRHRWEDNIRKDFWVKGYEDGNWVEQAQDRVQWWAVVMMMNFGFRSNKWYMILFLLGDLPVKMGTELLNIHSTVVYCTCEL